jgi:hypothetical protein
MVKFKYPGNYEEPEDLMIEADRDTKQMIRRRGLNRAAETVALMMPEILKRRKATSYNPGSGLAKAEMVCSGVLDSRREELSDEEWEAYEALEDAFHQGFDDALEVIEEYRDKLDVADLQYNLRRISEGRRELSSPEEIRRALSR